MIITKWALQESYLSVVLGQNKNASAVTVQSAKKQANNTTSKEIQVISCFGAIMPRDFGDNCFFYDCVSVSGMKEQFLKALQDDKIETIIFDFSSPGGQVEGVQEFSEIIYNARTKKNVIAFVGGLACSAGYWLASACSKVYASKTAEVGSIGVICSYYKDENLIKVTNTDSPLKASTENEEIKLILDELAGVFFRDISKYRTISTEKIKNFKGRSFVAQTGKENNLIDEIKSFEDVIKIYNKGVSMNEEELKEFNALKELVKSAAKEAADLRSEKANFKAEAESLIEDLKKQNDKLKYDAEQKKEDENFKAALDRKIEDFEAAGFHKDTKEMRDLLSFFSDDQRESLKKVDYRAMINNFPIPAKVNLSLRSEIGQPKKERKIFKI